MVGSIFITIKKIEMQLKFLSIELNISKVIYKMNMNMVFRKKDSHT